MAHFCVLVVTTAADGVSDALRPLHDDDRDDDPAQPHFVFVEDRHADLNPSVERRGYWRNPQGKWDGWITGGRSSGLLAIGTPDTSDNATPEAAGERLTAAGAATLLARDAALAAQVYALVIDGRWQEPPHHLVTVIDCHS